MKEKDGDTDMSTDMDTERQKLKDWGGGQGKTDKTYLLSWTSPIKEPCLQKSSA